MKLFLVMVYLPREDVALVEKIFLVHAYADSYAKLTNEKSLRNVDVDPERYVDEWETS